jgi:geranylgeranyl pyrophosphate synthase
MIHTYSLIHDDLPAMDDDDLRRGRATCHKRFDEATAILAGDVLQTLAFKTVADDQTLPAETRIQLISLIASASGTPHGMVAGQQLDLDGEGQELDLDGISSIHHRKTGALICAAARCGALIANAPGPEIAAVGEYADKLGLLFQITDDLLDATQTTEKLGKTAGKDAAVKKATYVSLLGTDKTRAAVSRTRDEACAAIERVSGRDTSLLLALADHVANRTK